MCGGYEKIQSCRQERGDKGRNPAITLACRGIEGLRRSEGIHTPLSVMAAENTEVGTLWRAGGGGTAVALPRVATVKGATRAPAPAA